MAVDGMDFTLGVEEEFVLLDPVDGAVTLRAPELLASLAPGPDVSGELMRFQIETATGVCRGLDEVRSELTRLRQTVATAAEADGCLMVAAGIPPGDLRGDTLTPEPRYRRMAQAFPELIDEAGTCACHVHVGLPSRDLGARILTGLRPWLSPLLALSVNSPVERGADSGWSSRRFPIWDRWPTARPPDEWSGAAAYDRSIGDALRRGDALDAAGVYFYARLSPRHPTVEVRIADVCLAVDDAVLLAALVRGLVATCAVTTRPPRARGTRIGAALTAAARRGLDGPGIDVFTGREADQRDLLRELVDFVRPALRAAGDEEDVERGLDSVFEHGTGAARQRRLFAEAASPGEFAAELAHATMNVPTR
ncbi:carboxylate--amine ligase [Amycolatopsis sp. WAC 01375]|uniref:carboxylate-amine ligase n=1 Tax=unclassified Amycolatopsis TaxID=2618356 RepID=UPI000F7702FC|nr:MULTISPECIES: glutamate--cysteine ligase [unclassified Amycolatopsis]RSM77586.1 carboxylate--amine ligase [Amycolatopsis sp. WAC 01375]RSN22239.1 carboxylate--amine ligase [Amycolatopsis sp. WAC 01416]